MSDTRVTAIEGATLRLLTTHGDERGSVTEVWRSSTPSGVVPQQWNVVRSRPGVLRGVHLHRQHGDLLVLVEGSAVVGLHDLRADSPSFRQAEMVELHAGGQALEIPPGVAHGFCFTEPSIHVYAVSHYFDPADDLGCRFDDPDLQFGWPIAEPRISERDQQLPSLRQLMATLHGQAPAVQPLV